MSDNKILLLQKSLLRLRPFLVLMRLIDAIKQKWDGKRLGMSGIDVSSEPPTTIYLQRLVDEILAKDNL